MLKNWTICGVLAQELLDKKVLSKEEVKFMEVLRIPLLDGLQLWTRKDRIDTKVLLAKERGLVSEYRSIPEKKFHAPYVISDDLGIKGVMNPATGKMHDSKSNYYKDVRAAGCEIMGNDAKVQERTKPMGDFDCRKEVAMAIEQTGFMEKRKRK